jgi:hypothetical protein
MVKEPKEVPKSQKTKSARKKSVPATAVIASNKNGSSHVVGIGNLRVMLFNDHGSWFAQGLEIDLCAQGSSLDDVKERFENGLRETIHQHLKTYGNIKGVLQIAPQEVWDEVYAAKPQISLYSQISLHEFHPALQFSGIEYYEKAAAA